LVSFRPDDAQNAAQKLFSSGFPRDHVDVPLNSSDASQNGEDAEQQTGFGDRLSNFFNSLFDNEEDSIKYSSVARKSSLVTIQAETHEEGIRASQILDNSGAIDVDGEYRMGSAETEDGTRNNLANNERRSIPVIEEQLQVGKREVETGRVKLRSRIIEKPVEETLRLREERVNVERTPANSRLTKMSFQPLKMRRLK
jgi:predicted DNA binding protein